MSKEQYADIIIDISHEKVDRPFQYRVPERLRGAVEAGMCVTVPFGGGNTLPDRLRCGGRRGRENLNPAKTKDIAGITQNGVSAEDKMIALAGWIRKNDGCTMIQALKTVLPAKKSVGKAGAQKNRAADGKRRNHFPCGKSVSGKNKRRRQDFSKSSFPNRSRPMNGLPESSVFPALPSNLWSGQGYLRWSVNSFTAIPFR